MSRPKGSKNKSDEESRTEVITETPQPEENKPEPEPEKLLSFFEASQHFGTTELTIKTWIDHGHLEERNGRIPMRSITMCKFNSRRVV